MQGRIIYRSLIISAFIFATIDFDASSLSRNVAHHPDLELGHKNWVLNGNARSLSGSDTQEILSILNDELML
jgi:hypothetical protein